MRRIVQILPDWLGFPLYLLIQFFYFGGYIMKTNRKKSLLSLIMVFSMMFLMLFPATVYADDAPPAEEATQEETTQTTDESVGEEPQATEEPAAEEETPEQEGEAVEEPVATEEPAAEEETPEPEGDAVEEPVANEDSDEELPDPQVTVEPEEEDLAEIVTALQTADAVLVDENGDAIPFASTDALTAMEVIGSDSSDPYFPYTSGGTTIWVGYTHPGVSCHPIVTECHEIENPIQAALDDTRSIGATIRIDGPAANYANDVFTLDRPQRFYLSSNENITVNTIYLNTSLANIEFAINDKQFFAQNIYILGGGATASIQDGIDIATDGGTVNVGPGTYTEQVKINKSVSVIGAGKDTTTINPDPTYTHCWGPPCGPEDRALVDIDGGDENAAGYTINVLFDGFTLDGQYLYGNKFGVLVHGGAFAEISNNHVKNFYDHAYPGGNQVNVLAGYWGQDWPWSGSAGRWYYTGHAYMHDNVVSGFNTVGMMIWGPNSTGVIDNNEINPDPTDSHLSAGAMGIVLQNSGDATISNNLITNLVTPGGPSGGAYRSGMEAYWPGNTTLFGNTFLNNDYGLATYNNWPQPGQSTFSITDNTFEGNQVGVQLGGVNISSLTGNSFINNSLVGVTNTMQTIVDATGNWWGSVNGPSALPATTYTNNGGLGAPTGSGDAISDYLIYDPYLSSDPGSGVGNGGTGGDDIVVQPVIGLPLGLIPVTGGEKVEIPCDSECVTFTLPDGSQAEFCGLCGYSMSLSEETEDTLPFEKPQDLTMLLGMTVNLFDESGTLLSDLPDNSSLTISFPMGTKIEDLLGIQLWDPGKAEWVSILDTLAVNGMLQAPLDWPGTAILIE